MLRVQECGDLPGDLVLPVRDHVSSVSYAESLKHARARCAPSTPGICEYPVTNFSAVESVPTAPRPAVSRRGRLRRRLPRHNDVDARNRAGRTADRHEHRQHHPAVRERRRPAAPRATAGLRSRRRGVAPGRARLPRDRPTHRSGTRGTNAAAALGVERRWFATTTRVPHRRYDEIEYRPATSLRSDAKRPASGKCSWRSSRRNIGCTSRCDRRTAASILRMPSASSRTRPGANAISPGPPTGTFEESLRPPR